MCTLNSECGYLLHFLPHGEDGLPHIGIGHLILSIASTTSRTPGTRMVSVSPCSALTPPMQRNRLPLARKLVIRPCAGICARRVSA